MTQSYTVIETDAAWMAEGAPQGWTQTLDKLAEEVLRMRASRRRNRSSSTPPSRSSAPTTRRSSGSGCALTDAQAKAKVVRRPAGRVGGDRARHGLPRRRRRARQGALEERGRLDFRRRLPRHRSEQRIVYSYDMHLDERKISVSLATMELEGRGPRPHDASK